MHRRHFLAQTTALALSTAFTPRCTALAADPTPAQPHAAKLGWHVSVQQFTYRRFSLFEALDKLAAVGLRHIELRSNVKLDPNEPGVLTDENMPEIARRRLKAALPTAASPSPASSPILPASPTRLGASSPSGKTLAPR